MSSPPCASDSLVEAAVKILQTGDPWLKASYTNQVVEWWRSGCMATLPCSQDTLHVPERPSRSDDKVKVVPPGRTPKRGKGGSLASRQALLHSLCHIENWAVDLSWDIIARFGGNAEYNLPREFFDDFVTVAEDECRHFLLLEQRLKEVGSYYGALPVHDGLWESASHTAHSLPARLAVESCVHEARGLDVLPLTIAKFRNNGDEPTAALLERVVYPEEVNHCRAGVKWFRYLHQIAHRIYSEPNKLEECASSSSTPQGHSSTSEADGLVLTPKQNGQEVMIPSWVVEAQRFHNVDSWFHDVVAVHFWGSLKPPFNTEARAQAGFEESWYLPLVEKTGKRREEQQEAGPVVC
ncbi:hypothetical protein CEUSTIGMA_g1951.t1 [Chlamydomonas eustigma]|uniref:DUF455 domain-containing protein n=1 Tax=Chlamydomonas eustigma TaxID=1157962 RepID=A0A250WV51_9CHLO|nr:hypothetical protein CEUSTIGMA_g1951.t1 [Chlamydomonas eustigma]|eukprot:GAX74502.1 hypothetical protein CEUSTIGMA_g1951.t1 [Chlamydomonas eustigma]